MIYVTGDIHGEIDIHKLSSKAAKNAAYSGEEICSISEGDYLIICGDFGLVWSSEDSPYYKAEQNWLEWLNNKPYTTLFVDGNHENHDMLDAMPVSEWNGGKVHFVSDKIIHLMRGQVFNIDGYTFFTMGGASSHDKEHRVEGESWWARELPDQDEFDEAKRNLELHNNSVDFIITHCGPSNVQNRICPYYATDDLVLFFDDLEQRINYKRWYNGHYHCDMDFGRHTIIYDKIIPIEI